LAPRWYPIVKFHDTDVGYLCPLPLPVFLEEDKGPDHDVLAASGVGARLDRFADTDIVGDQQPRVKILGAFAGTRSQRLCL
jgi:hypothetical protein